MADRQIRLEKDTRNIRLWIHQRQLTAEQWRLVEYNAAIKIQSWFRGTRLRCYIKILNQKAVIIQKFWRGILGRKAYLNRLKDVVKRIELMYYNKMATVKQFRGWYVRRHIFDFYVWKNYFIIVGQKNEYLRKQIEDYWIGNYNPKTIENQRILKILKYEHKKSHYLLSTQAQNGIYQQTKHPEFSKIENWVKRMKPAIKGHRIDRTKPFSLIKTLEPVKLPMKPPGPFKDPQDIHAIKIRPAIPLRMQDDAEGTKIISEKEKLHEEGLWIHDKPFNIWNRKPCQAEDYSIFLSVMHKEPELKLITDEHPSRNISTHDFKIPKFPDPMSKLFEKHYGDYSDVV